MIYLFNQEGRCLLKSTEVRDRAAGNSLAARILEDARPRGAVASVVSDHEYDINDIYYTRGKIEVRPPCPARLDGLVLSNLPSPSIVVIEGKRYTIADNQVTLSFSYPGTYVVKVQSWPYKDRNFKVVSP